MQKSSFIFFFIFFIFFSCKKNDIVPSAIDNICDKDWLFITAKITPKPPKNIVIVPYCEMDDILRFYKNQSMFFDAGNDKCSIETPQREYARWTLSNNGNYLLIKMIDDEITYRIVQNDGNKLQLSENVVWDNVVYTVLYTYSK